MLVELAQALGPVQQEYLLEARQMQALSFAVHIPLVCFGIAFPSLVVLAEWLYLRTGDRAYRELARRWSKAMLALFAVGVVTGTILSFELGLLWPNFMATFGDVFGFAFALEGISFFVEAIFIAIYVYGWDRFSPRRHLLSGIPIIVAGISGSLMVLSVNAWMNNPSGFLIAGTYAWAWLRGSRTRYVRLGLTIALTAAALAAPVQILVGDWIARQVAEDQPTKLAAFEGLGRTESGAALHVGGWYDEDSGDVEYGIGIPYLLSFLAHHDPNAEVQGLDVVPADEQPPVNVVRLSFQTMVGIGFLLAAIGLIHLYRLVRRRGPPESPWFFRAVVAAGPLSVVALICGWVTTEVGRQPWVVYGVMRTEEAVTGADGVPVGYATLALVYAALVVATAWILRRLSRVPMEAGLGGPR